MTGPVVRQLVLPELDAALVKTRESIPLDDGWGSRIWAVRKRPPERAKASVVLLHGLAQNRYAFHMPGWSLSGWLAQHGYDTWNVELRGSGLSRETSPLPGNIDAYIRHDFPAVVRHVARATGAPVYAIGHSLGGFILYGAVPELRGQIAGAVAIASLVRFGRASWSFATLRRLYGLVPPPADRMLRHLPTGLPARLLSLPPATGLMNDARFRHAPIRFWEPGGMAPERAGWWLRHGFERAPLGVLRQLARSTRHGRFVSADGAVDYYARWRAQPEPVPFLAIHGDRDAFISNRDARASLDATPGEDKRLRIFGPADGGRHWGHVDVVHGDLAPTYVWPEILQWLDERVGE